MRNRVKILGGTLAILTLTFTGLLTFGGDLLQGRFATPGVSLPDLIPAPAATSLALTGEVGLDEGGNVVDYNVTFDSRCAIRNVGPVTASGASFTWCHFLYGTRDGAIIFSNPELFSLSLAQRTALAYTATRTDEGDLSDKFSYYIDFFQDLYDGGGTFTMSVEHSLDYDTGVFIVESREMNNSLTQSIIVSDVGIVWAVR